MPQAPSCFRASLTSVWSWALAPDVTPPDSQDSGGNLSLQLSQAHYSELGAAWTTGNAQGKPHRQLRI